MVFQSDKRTAKEIFPIFRRVNAVRRISLLFHDALDFTSFSIGNAESGDVQKVASLSNPSLIPSTTLQLRQDEHVQYVFALLASTPKQHST